MVSRFLPEGIPAPQFELAAVYNRRRFRLSDHAGRPVLLVFLGYETRDSLREVLQAVRTVYPALEQVVVAGVINLLFVPALLRKMAESRMENAIQQALKEAPLGFDPMEHLIMLPDWNGNVSRTYRISELGEHSALVLIDTEGSIHGHYQGNQPAQAALELVAGVVGYAQQNVR